MQIEGCISCKFRADIGGIINIFICNNSFSESYGKVRGNFYKCIWFDESKVMTSDQKIEELKKHVKIYRTFSKSDINKVFDLAKRHVVVECDRQRIFRIFENGFLIGQGKSQAKAMKDFFDRGGVIKINNEII